jgi:hypothetical protein
MMNRILPVAALLCLTACGPNGIFNEDFWDFTRTDTYQRAYGYDDVHKQQQAQYVAQEAIYWDDPAARQAPPPIQGTMPGAMQSHGMQLRQPEKPIAASHVMPYQYRDPQRMFAMPVSSAEHRMKRIEDAIVALRQDMNTMLPMIVQSVSDKKQSGGSYTKPAQAQPAHNNTVDMSAIMRSSQQAMQQTQNHASAYPASYGAKGTASAAKTAWTPPMYDTAAHGANGPEVMKLRFGGEKGTTRLVFDVAGSTPYRFDLDNGENILIIELPNASWGAARSWTAAKPDLVKSYSVQDMNGGSRVILQLTRPANVVKDMLLKAGSYKYDRIVLDLR